MGNTKVGFGRNLSEELHYLWLNCDFKWLCSNSSYEPSAGQRGCRGGINQIRRANSHPHQRFRGPQDRRHELRWREGRAQRPWNKDQKFQAWKVCLEGLPLAKDASRLDTETMLNEESGPGSPSLWQSPLGIGYERKGKQSPKTGLVSDVHCMPSPGEPEPENSFSRAKPGIMKDNEHTNSPEGKARSGQMDGAWNTPHCRGGKWG